MVGGEAAPEWAGVEAERRGQLDGEVERRHGNGGAALGARVQGPSSASNRRTREGRWCWGGRAARAGGQRPGLGRRQGRGGLGAAACRRGGVAERASGRDVLDDQRAATKQAGWQQRRGGVAGRRGSSGAAAGAASSVGAARQAAAQLPCSAFECRE